jgi:hypothetical protein
VLPTGAPVALALLDAAFDDCRSVADERDTVVAVEVLTDDDDDDDDYDYDDDHDDDDVDDKLDNNNNNNNNDDNEIARNNKSVPTIAAPPPAALPYDPTLDAAVRVDASVVDHLVITSCYSFSVFLCFC